MVGACGGIVGMRDSYHRHLTDLLTAYLSVHYVLDFLVGEKDGMPKDPNYIYR